MREIKFRAWNKKKKIMVYEDEDNSSQYLDGWMASDVQVLNQTLNYEYVLEKYEFMQYTGLKDKNGKEIYEGDIILTQPFRDKPFSHKFKEKRLRGIVVYNIKCGKNFVGEPDKIKYWGAEWNVDIIDKKDYKKYCNFSWGSFFECEVIGNIYENSELLKED